jgi:hypothetical protein
MQGMYINSDGEEIGVSRWCRCKDGAGKARARGRWHHGARPAQASRGKCNNGVAKEVMEERENG